MAPELTRAQMIEVVKENCQFLTYGACTTRACLVRGGYQEGPIAGFTPTCPYRQIVDTDAALRTQLDRSMRVQELLAANVNNGLLEIRELKAHLQARDATIDTMKKDCCEHSQDHARAQLKINEQRATIARLMEEKK